MSVTIGIYEVELDIAPGLPLPGVEVSRERAMARVWLRIPFPDAQGSEGRIMAEAHEQAKKKASKVGGAGYEIKEIRRRMTITAGQKRGKRV